MSSDFDDFETPVLRHDATGTYYLVDGEDGMGRVNVIVPPDVVAALAAAAPPPLSPESEAMLREGIEDAKQGRIRYLGSFAQYADAAAPQPSEGEGRKEDAEDTEIFDRLTHLHETVANAADHFREEISESPGFGMLRSALWHIRRLRDEDGRTRSEHSEAKESPSRPLAARSGEVPLDIGFLIDELVIAAKQESWLTAGMGDDTPTGIAEARATRESAESRLKDAITAARSGEVTDEDVTTACRVVKSSSEDAHDIPGWLMRRALESFAKRDVTLPIQGRSDG